MTLTAQRPAPVAPEERAGVPRSRVPWRVAGRLARRTVRRSRGRTALVAGLLALPLAFSTLMLVSYSMQSQPADPADRLDTGVEAELTWRGGPVLQSGPDPRDAISVSSEPEVLTWDEGLARILDVLPAASGSATGGCTSGYVPGNGGGTHVSTCTYLPIGAGGGVLAGRAPTTPTEALAPAGGRWPIGATVDLVLDGASVPLTVVGTYDQGPYMIYEDLRVGASSKTPALEEVTVRLTSPAVTWSDVVRLNEAGFVAVARAALLDPPADADIPFLAQGHSIRSFDGPSNGADLAVVALGLAAILLLIVLVVGPAQVVGVRRQTRTYALLAATGADARTLRWVVLLSAALQGLVAAVCGIGLGLAVVLTLQYVAPNALTGSSVEMVVPWLQLAGIALLSVLLVIAAALVPARTASRLDVVRVLAGRRGEAHPRRRTPLVGLGLLALGLALGVWAVLSTSAVAVVGALASVVVGLLLCAGGLVAGAARILAPRTSLPVRLALRDAARHRSRSVAAVCAVTAAAATLVGASLVVASDTAHFQAARTFAAGHGVVVTYVSSEVVDGAPTLADVEKAVRAADPGARTDRVLAIGMTRPGFEAPVQLSWDDGVLEVDPNADLVCPASSPGADLATDVVERLASEDPRCAPGLEQSYGTGWMAQTFVDDGTWTGASGLADSEAIAAALASGRAVVADRTNIQDDGTIRVRYVPATDDDTDTEGTDTDGTGAAGPDAGAWTTVPALHVPVLERTGYRTILPPVVVADLGLASAPVGLLTRPSSPDRAAAVESAAKSAAGSRGWTDIEDFAESGNPTLTAVILGASFVLGIGTAGLVLLLVAGEARADLAVLSAVGAAPRTRRRLLAAQAGVLVAIGTVLGSVVGFVGAAGFVALSARRNDGIVDPTWTLAVPWWQVVGIVVLLPVGAWLTGWLTTRSRMPLPSEVR
ncbi:ABC transporter permease [Sanguibacter sp. HDW7]|uniref:ABC transporter permease n=1 Tax=Sanguibacter sp. HDW7 TaxID=2714931 RepID=UPI00140D64B7|nr:ABC transporter permease [Sanguibacter sp. HDW7]QIK83928.1 ABC transporter permease [Sanguibacter sp. HDW7]